MNFLTLAMILTAWPVVVDLVSDFAVDYDDDDGDDDVVGYVGYCGYFY